MSKLPIRAKRRSPVASSGQPQPLDRVGDAVLVAVDQAVESRWDRARRRAEQASGATIEARVKRVTAAFAKELTALGAATGAAAAVPGAGRVASVATMATEMGWFTLRVADLILTIAAVHGHDEASVEERRAWVLSLLAFGDAAHKGFDKVAGEVGKGLSRRAVDAIPASSLQSINRALGRTVVTKYGTKRGAVALGRLMPFGIGAAVGGGLNYVTVRSIARQADSFFRQAAESDAAVEAVGRVTVHRPWRSGTDRLTP